MLKIFCNFADRQYEDAGNAEIQNAFCVAEYAVYIEKKTLTMNTSIFLELHTLSRRVGRVNYCETRLQDIAEISGT